MAKSMRVLLLGATGFIGSAVSASLRVAGHHVYAVARPGSVPNVSTPGTEWLEIDIARATRIQDWQPHLGSVDAVVNCAGVFQDSPRDSTRGVHCGGPSTLFDACVTAQVRRIVQISAAGIDREAPSAFSRSKLAGDQHLMALDLDWVILRPSVVVGRSAYGSGALFRGLAALPLLPVVPGTGPLQVVQIDDLARTVLHFIAPHAPAKLVLEVVGPERLEMTEIVRRYRSWLGWRPAREIPAPGWMMAAVYWLGDFAGLLGWRPPIRSNARLEMGRGSVGDPRAWIETTRIRPATIEEALATDPASVQERWFAQIYFLKPLALAVLAAFWVATGIISLGPGWEGGVTLLGGTALADVAPAAVILGALVDIAVGIGIAIRRTCRIALYLAVAVSLAYAAALSVVRPELWQDPLGPALKIWPIVVLTLVALAILRDR